MSTAPSATYVDRLPTAREFIDLFDSVGWDHYGESVVAAALEGSLLGVVGLLDGVVVSMGRVVGDGAKFFYLQDLVVRPGFQRAGIGRETVRRLMDRVATMAPDSQFVGVFSTPEARSLYERFGMDAGFGGLTGMAAVREGASTPGPPDGGTSDR